MDSFSRVPGQSISRQMRDFLLETSRAIAPALSPPVVWNLLDGSVNPVQHNAVS